MPINNGSPLRRVEHRELPLPGTYESDALAVVDRIGVSTSDANAAVKNGWDLEKVHTIIDQVQKWNRLLDEHDLRECWVVPSGSAERTIVYDAKYFAADGVKALGYATLSAPLPCTPVTIGSLTEGPLLVLGNRQIEPEGKSTGSCSFGAFINSARKSCRCCLVRPLPTERHCAAKRQK